MKILCAIVSVVLVIHLQCGGLCLADSIKSAANEQSCPQHSDAPEKQSHQPDDTSSRCGQGSLIEARIAFAAKHILAVIVPFVPELTAFLLSDESFHPAFREENPPGKCSSQTIGILRI